MDLRFWKGALTAGLEFAAALLGLAAMVAWFLRWQKKKRLVAHLLRLASDIVSVSESVEEDLESHVGGGVLGSFRARSRACRETAEAFLAHKERLDRIRTIRITRALEQLHDEHRRIVDLRSEVDVALSSWRRSPQVGAGRTRNFGWAPKGGYSGWPSSGFHTRPSTLA